MAIFDAKVEVMCDGCEREFVDVDLPFVYFNMNPSSGHYDHRDETIEKILVREHGWTVEDGKHYCDGCSEERGEDDS